MVSLCYVILRIYEVFGESVQVKGILFFVLVMVIMVEL